MNLSDYVNKEVAITLANGSTYIGKFTRCKYYYEFRYNDPDLGDRFCNYNESGTHLYLSKEYDLISIKVNERTPIDLSQYVNKEVTITLANGSRFTGEFHGGFATGYNYDFYGFGKASADVSYLMSFDKTGVPKNKENSHIESIRELNPTKQVNKKDCLDSLESKTLQCIASALTPEAIKYIESHEKYAETMMELIQEFLKTNLGEIKGELPFMMMDRIYLNKSKE
jgi:small nuclear ribonucleoprotein (snRNP)-like protein